MKPTMADVWEQLTVDDKGIILKCLGLDKTSTGYLALKTIDSVYPALENFLRSTCQCDSCREVLNPTRIIANKLRSAARCG